MTQIQEHKQPSQFESCQWLPTMMSVMSVMATVQIWFTAGILLLSAGHPNDIVNKD